VSVEGWVHYIEVHGDRRRVRGSFGCKCGTSHCNQWGLCGVAILCREGWRRGSSQIILEFLVYIMWHWQYNYAARAIARS